MHRVDRQIPVGETLRALDDLIQQGKVRYIGASNFDALHLCEAEWTSIAKNLNRFVSVQNYHNLLKRDIERELTPFCEAYEVGIIPFFPLESGFLTGKYRRGEAAPEGTRLNSSQRGYELLTDANFDILDKLESFAQQRDHSLLDLAIAGLAAQPAVASIIANAAAEWALSSEYCDPLDAMVGSSHPDRRS